jgi:uracil-DNA glycosylase
MSTKPKLILNIVDPIEESWTIEDIVKKAPPPGWRKQFKEAEAEIVETSQDILNDEITYGKCYPLRKDIFNAFYLTPLNRVRVVIIGQDPYHTTCHDGLPQACGMSFSVRRSSSIPPSLRNIYRELERSIPNFVPPSHGDLRSWARQGVLLLNKCLTVRPGQPGSHKDIWMGFLLKVLSALAEYRPNAIYVLWGNKAQELQTKGYISDRATILTGYHPSGYNGNKFIGNNHFVEINKILTERGELPIDWQPT